MFLFKIGVLGCLGDRIGSAKRAVSCFVSTKFIYWPFRVRFSSCGEGTRARSVDQGPHKPSKTWFSLSNKLVLVRENLDFSWFGSGPWDVFVEDKPF